MVFEHSAQISVRKLMEGSEASSGASTVDHHRNKAQLGHRLKPKHTRERFGYEKCLRARVDEFHDRIPLRGIKIRRMPNQTVKLGCVVRGFSLEWCRRSPPRLCQLADVRLLQHAHD